MGWHHIVVPAIEMKCFDEHTFQGNVGVGQDDFERQRDEVFVSKRASDLDIHEFLKQINANDDRINKGTG